MKFLWKILRSLMAIAGFFLIYGGFSESDYYVIELCQPQPDYIWTMVAIGVALMLPALIHFIITGVRGDEI